MSTSTSLDPLAELRTTATVSIPRAAELLGICKSHAYVLARDGRLPVIELGPRRMRVKSADLLRMLEGEE
ncbi:helix-turn-helix domain-containing protein [Nocardia cyriacigeorgica]|uniref:helix-turn-helix domain-containing protein n=1 Tax=Nocardia cyriacigeorgica TaxID=135487 RepID=UPI00030C006F|nr:helix-turn-helix domain-containing protein [Nocardia cyriacigeorgica]